MSRPLAPILFSICCLLGCGESADVAWPVSGSTELNADSISSPFGPRDQSGKHDFHAGVDFPLEEGTKIRAIKAGVVEKVEKHDGGTGPGNWVLIDHGEGEKSSYLHLKRSTVRAGQSIDAGQVLGRSGSTGSSSPHLHLTYMVGIEGAGADENLARNPLELLPHDEMPAPEVSFESNAVILEIAIQPMTIQTITVSGEGQSRELDYAEIFALGNPVRDNQTQSGLRLAVGEGAEGNFTLRLQPDPANFVPQRVVASNYAGEIVLDESRS